VSKPAEDQGLEKAEQSKQAENQAQEKEDEESAKEYCHSEDDDDDDGPEPPVSQFNAIVQAPLRLIVARPRLVEMGGAGRPQSKPLSPRPKSGQNKH
jgi:hypothetical protein